MGISQVELGSQLHAILDAEVFLTLKVVLQGLELVVAEGGSGLSLFLVMLTGGELAAATAAAIFTKGKESSRLLRAFCIPVYRLTRRDHVILKASVVFLLNDVGEIIVRRLET